MPKKLAKGPYKRRTATRPRTKKRKPAVAYRPGRGGKKRFAPRDRVFHLVDPARFVKTEDAEGFERIGPAPDARTICCDQAIADVYAVATDKDKVTDVRWCAGVK